MVQGVKPEQKSITSVSRSMGDLAGLTEER